MDWWAGICAALAMTIYLSGAIYMDRANARLSRILDGEDLSAPIPFTLTESAKAILTQQNNRPNVR